MNYWWADCESDWKEEMEWFTAAVVGSGIMSSRWDYVMHTARGVRLTLIHTLPYLPHTSHMGGHLSTLAKCKVDGYAKMHPCTHTLARRGVNHLHRTPLFYSNSWLTPWKTSGVDRSMQLGKYSVVAAVCVCVRLYSAYRKGVYLPMIGSTLPAVIL